MEARRFFNLMNIFDKVKKETTPIEQGVKCKCGWKGKHTELIRNGSVSYSDEWWECPSCGGDSSKRTSIFI